MPSIGSRCRIGPPSSHTASPVGNTTSPAAGSPTGCGAERSARRRAPPTAVRPATRRSTALRPDEMMQLVAPERVAGAEQMLRTLVDLARRVVERHPQLDHQRLGRRPRRGAVRRRPRSADSRAAASITTRRQSSHPAGARAHRPTIACRPSAAGPRRPCQPDGAAAGPAGGERFGDGSGFERQARASRARPSTARTSAGRAWAPPQYTHEITPATLTTGCDSGRERGLLPDAPHLDRFQMKAAGRAGRNPYEPLMDRPTSRILRLAAASLAVVAGTAVWPLASATPVAQALDNTPWVLPSSPPRCTTQKVESGDVAGCVITFYDEPSSTGWGVPPAPGVGDGWTLERLLVQRLAGPGDMGVDVHRLPTPSRSPGCARARCGRTSPCARPVRGVPRRDQRQGVPRPRRQRLLVPLHRRQRRLELPERRSGGPVQPCVGSGDRHQRRHQPDPQLLLDRRRDRVHDPDPDGHAAMGDPDRREVGPLLGWLRMERRLPEHVDPAHRGLSRMRPTSSSAARPVRRPRSPPSICTTTRTRSAARSSTTPATTSSSARARRCRRPACGCPVQLTPPAGAVAAMINLTATEGAAAGYLTLEDCGARSGPRTTSALTYAAGQSVAAMAIVPISSTGRFCVYRSSAVHSDRRRHRLSRLRGRTAVVSAVDADPADRHPRGRRLPAGSGMHAGDAAGLHEAVRADRQQRRPHRQPDGGRLTAPGWLQVGRCADVGPEGKFSNLNVGDAGARANMALVPAGDSGTCALGMSQANVIVDELGRLSPTTGSAGGWRPHGA